MFCLDGKKRLMPLCMCVCEFPREAPLSFHHLKIQSRALLRSPGGCRGAWEQGEEGIGGREAPCVRDGQELPAGPQSPARCPRRGADPGDGSASKINFS